MQCMVALFLFVTRPVSQVAKGMRWGMFIVETGGWEDLPREIFIILKVHGCVFNALLDHWFYNHKE